MKFVRIFICAILFTFLLNESFGQECKHTLSGAVIDEHDGKPLDYAHIYIMELNKGIITDSLGRYTITGLCPGTYTVRCTHIGCDPVISTIRISSDTRLNFFPEHHAEELKELTIHAEKKEEEEGILVSEQVSAKERSQTAGQALGDVLKRSVGVTTLNTGSGISKPVIHGLHSNRILILNNGIRQEGQQWGTEHAPEIDPFIADKITVIKGAAGVKYGPDAIGGVILTEPAPLRDSAGIGAAVDLAGYTNGRQGTAAAVLDGNFKKMPALSWRMQGSLKRGGNVQTANYYLKNTGLKEENFSLAAQYKKKRFSSEIFYSRFKTDMGIFSGAHIGNLSDLYRAFESAEPAEKAGFSYEIERPRQHVRHELFKVAASIDLGKFGTLEPVYAKQYNLRYEYDKHRSLNDSIAALDLPQLQFAITSHTGNLLWKHKKIGGFEGEMGISGIWQTNTYKGRYFIPNFRNSGAGIFLLERYKAGTKLELEAGVRYDYRFLEVFKYENNVLINPQYSFNNISGTLGGMYKWNKRLTVKLNLGSGWRPPNVSELFSNGLHHGAASVEIGDRNLQKESSYQAGAAINYERKNFSMHLGPYYNYLKNFIYLRPELPATLTIRGAFPTYVYTQTDAGLGGLDISMAWDFYRNFEWTSKISLLRAFNLTTGEYLVQMPADRMENVLEYKFSGSRRFSENYLSVSMQNVAKQFRVPDNSDYVAPPEAYTLFGIQAGTRIKTGKTYIQVGVGVNNLFNKAYRDYLNRFRYYADDTGRNISVRVKIPFQIYQLKNVQNE